jgi:hypothetical protein
MMYFMTFFERNALHGEGCETCPYAGAGALIRSQPLKTDTNTGINGATFHESAPKIIEKWQVWR